MWVSATSISSAAMCASRAMRWQPRTWEAASRARSCTPRLKGACACAVCGPSRIAASPTASRSTSPRWTSSRTAAKSSSSSSRMGQPLMTDAATHSHGGTSARRIRVLVVDDSALVRQMLTDMLQGDPAIEVVGSAGDAHIARQKIKQLSPDVLTLDVEMPKMDGVTFLRNLMRLRPMPVVMVSSLTDRGADVTLDALAVGAVDYLAKPKIDIAATLGDYASELIEKVKVAAGVSVRALETPRTPSQVPPRHSADAVLPRQPPARALRTTDRIVAIGASTGGTEAIKQVLTRLPADAPGVVI